MPAGCIVNQTPAAGTPGQPGDIVQVTISGGSAYVPNLSERTVAEAQNLLLSAGLTAGVNMSYTETSDASLHGRIAGQSPAAGDQVMAGATVSLTLYRVPSLTHAALVTLQLPASTGNVNVRVTLTEAGVERTIWQMDYAADTSRLPEIEISARLAGDYVYKVYIDDKFAYQQTVTLE